MSPDFQTTVGLMPEPEWHAISELFDDASIYQSRAYAEICWRRSKLTHLVLRKANDVVAAAQIRLVKLPVIKAGIAYIRWGPMFRRKGRPVDPEIFESALTALREEFGRRQGLLLRLIPNVYVGDPWEATIRRTLLTQEFTEDPQTSPYRTLRVDLKPSMEEVRKGFHQRWRNKLKNAEKAGYTVSHEDSDAYYAQFLVAYDQMMARKRFPTTVDVREFAELQHRLREPQRMQIFHCTRDGILLNALVVAVGGDTGIYLLAATSDAGLEGNGAFLLQWHALQWLKENGIRWYDMGGINPDANPGVYQFKTGAGGQDTFQLGHFGTSTPRLSHLLIKLVERFRHNPRRKTVQPNKEASVKSDDDTPPPRSNFKPLQVETAEH